MRGRPVALGLFLLGTGALLAWALRGGPAPVPPVPPNPPAAAGGGTDPAPAAVAGGGGAATGLVFTHPVQCKSCHAEVYEEWSTSMHAKAWTDPEVRALSDDFKDTECLSCHVPQPVHSAPPGGRLFERASRFETGVDCLSCHLLPDGRVAALRDLPGAPCRPAKVPTLADPVTCKGCHNQHYLVDEWEHMFSKPDPAKGAILKTGRPENCLDCHMPPSPRAASGERPARSGRNHFFPGGHDVEMLRRGVALAVRVEGGEVVAEATNVAVGHRAPADSRHRSFNVWVTVVSGGGATIRDRVEIAEYRMYYRSPPRENTNLRPGETGTSRFALPAGVHGRVLVELVYALNPIRKEKRDVLHVHREEREFDTR